MAVSSTFGTIFTFILMASVYFVNQSEQFPTEVDLNQEHLALEDDLNDQNIGIEISEERVEWDKIKQDELENFLETIEDTCHCQLRFPDCSVYEHHHNHDDNIDGKPCDQVCPKLPACYHVSPPISKCDHSQCHCKIIEGGEFLHWKKAWENEVEMRIQATIIMDKPFDLNKIRKDGKNSHQHFHQISPPCSPASSFASIPSSDEQELLYERYHAFED